MSENVKRTKQNIFRFTRLEFKIKLTGNKSKKKNTLI